MLTGTKPSTPCRNLCVKAFKQLRSKMHMAGQRVASSIGSVKHSAMIEQIISTTMVGRTMMAAEQGFADEWLQVKKGVKRGCPPSLARPIQPQPRMMAQPVQCTLAKPEQSAQSTGPPQRVHKGGSPSCLGTQSGSSGGSLSEPPSRFGSNAERQQETAQTEPPRSSSASHHSQENEGSDTDESKNSSGSSESGSSESDGGGESDGSDDCSGAEPLPLEGGGSPEAHQPGMPTPGGVPDPVSHPHSLADDYNNRFFKASAQSEQHHNLNDRIVEALPCEEDMLVAGPLTSIREFLGQDALDGGVAGRCWADLLKGAYPEWGDAPLDRVLACLVRRCRVRRGEPGNHRQLESIEYWAVVAHITLAMVKVHYECSRFDKNTHQCTIASLHWVYVCGWRNFAFPLISVWCGWPRSVRRLWLCARHSRNADKTMDGWAMRIVTSSTPGTSRCGWRPCCISSAFCSKTWLCWSSRSTASCLRRSPWLAYCDIAKPLAQSLGWVGSGRLHQSLSSCSMDIQGSVG
jgi:hypothetical protein